MKILILGEGKSGKDTCAEYIRDAHGLSFQSSSMAFLEVIWPALKAAGGFKTQREAFNERRKHRLLWKELINLYTYHDKSSLAKLILSTCDMYVGMRCEYSYEASKHLFDHILYLDTFDRVIADDKSMTIKYDKREMVQICTRSKRSMHVDVDHFFKRNGGLKVN